MRDYRLGLLHGRMKGADKDRVMAAFAAGEISVLVSTTVIEVGVDVPNAVITVSYTHLDVYKRQVPFP